MLRICTAIGMLGLTVALVAKTTRAQVIGPSGEPRAPVTFTRDVLPILQKDCQSCHRPGQIAPMSLLTYEEARPWARSIKAKVVARAMPPWFADPQYGHFVNDRSLTQLKIDTLAAWVDSGALRGDPKDAPPPVQWAPEGWLVQPDVVVTLPDYPVPASGVIEWESLAIPSPFPKDTWITSVEILPSDHSTVHHMCFQFEQPRPEVVYNRYEWAEIPRDNQGAPIQRADPTDDTQPKGVWILTRDVGSTEVNRRFGDPTLTPGGSNCYVPGMSLHDYRPLGAGQLVLGGANMILSLHYQTIGKTVTNRVRIGFTVAKEPPKKKIVQITPRNTGAALAIPPNASNYLAPSAQVEIKRDAELVWMMPHMHYRGKDMTWTLVRPNGIKEIVLSVQRYQYNWQLQYQTRVTVPAGSKMVVEAHFDNSARNKFNPDPNAWVYYGNQAWEEMMSGFTWFVVDADVDEEELVTGDLARPNGA